MDKYEFNIKVEQIKKMAKVGDYSGAMKAADEIDWRRVSSVSLLSLVSEIYEKNRDYSEAKEILLLAYEKAPIGKRLLYKLTMLALNEDNIPEAEAYYREFYDLAPDDSRQHILRYLILKAKGAPVDQLISSLEQYNREELDERWMYELAELYGRAGRVDECVAMCDKVMLMFGIGKYVDKAMDLKLQEGQPLNEYQQNLIDSRDMYEERLKDMEEHPDKYDPDADAVVVEKPENYDQENMVAAEPAVYDTRPAPAAYDTKQTAVYGAPEAARPVSAGVPVHSPRMAEPAPVQDDGPDEIVKADIAAILAGACTAGNVGAHIREEDEIKIDRDRIFTATAGEVRSEEAEQDSLPAPETAPTAGTAKEAGAGDWDVTETAIPAAAAAVPESDDTETQEGDDGEMTIYTVNFIVERRKEEDGVDAAVRLLRLMHEHTGSRNQVAKIKAGRLNSIGVLASREKLAGKDLVIEQAGDLAYSGVEEVMELIKLEPAERVVVLIDNPMQIRKMLSAYPELLQLFHVDKEGNQTVQQEEEPKAEKASAARTPEHDAAAACAPTYNDDHYAAEPAPAPEQVRTKADGMTGTPAKQAAPGRMDEEMDIDEFANYAQQYAESIDCSISGKSKLALYERIELMEEDGIRLTGENAVALIEEAADKAEKKSIGSLFKAKYDKDDRLILREEHFVG